MTKANPPQFLNAGPIRVKFQDGELRYLRVGNREILRRIYFGVREADFNTDLPTFHHVEVDAEPDHFTVQLAASCRGKTIGFDWQARIVGSADGTITFHVEGAAPTDGASKRIGLCALYGVEALAGRPYELVDNHGKTTTGEFPVLVAPEDLAHQFSTLRYTVDGLQFSCGITGSKFDMEDQRLYGDSSFKAYSPLPYDYPTIPGGKVLEQTLIVTVGGNIPAPEPTASVIRIKLGGKDSGAKIPMFISPDQLKDSIPFLNINRKRDKFRGATELTWPLTPATHLPDDDVVMENLPTIVYQEQTIASFAPKATLNVGPIKMNGRWPGQVRPPGFAAAWTAAQIKYLALAGVQKAAFADLAPEAQQIVSALTPFAGQPLMDVQMSPETSGIDALAVGDDLWVINKSNEKQNLEAPQGQIQLQPFEVRRLTAMRQ
jgi:hypothetical protein